MLSDVQIQESIATVVPNQRNSAALAANTLLMLEQDSLVIGREYHVLLEGIPFNTGDKVTIADDESIHPIPGLRGRLKSVTDGIAEVEGPNGINYQVLASLLYPVA